MTKDSTKIKDLPDNKENEVSSKIIKELNKKQEGAEDDESVLSEESETEEQEALVKTSSTVSPSNKSSMSFSESIMSLLKDSAIVFVIFFVISSPIVIKNISTLPYISKFEVHSNMFNLIVAAIAAVLFFISKYSVDCFM